MRKAEFAESFLSLVTSRERAISMVGDLQEEEDPAKPWRFWTFLAGAWASQLGSQVKTSPIAMAGATLFAMCVELILILSWVLGFGILNALLEVNYHLHSGQWFVVGIPMFLTYIVVPVQMGRWIARRFPQRTGAAVVTLACAHAATNICTGWLFGSHVDVNITILIPLITWDGDLTRALLVAAFYLSLYPMLLLTGAMTRSLSGHARFTRV